jgi:outer membrane protein assembly factor BamB
MLAVAPSDVGTTVICPVCRRSLAVTHTVEEPARSSPSSAPVSAARRVPADVLDLDAEAMPFGRTASVMIGIALVCLLFLPIGIRDGQLFFWWQFPSSAPDTRFLLWASAVGVLAILGGLLARGMLLGILLASGTLSTFIFLLGGRVHPVQTSAIVPILATIGFMAYLAMLRLRCRYPGSLSIRVVVAILGGLMFLLCLLPVEGKVGLQYAISEIHKSPIGGMIIAVIVSSVLALLTLAPQRPQAVSSLSKAAGAFVYLGIAYVVAWALIEPFTVQAPGDLRATQAMVLGHFFGRALCLLFIGVSALELLMGGLPAWREAQSKKGGSRAAAQAGGRAALLCPAGSMATAFTVTVGVLGVTILSYVGANYAWRKGAASSPFIGGLGSPGRPPVAPLREGRQDTPGALVWEASVLESSLAGARPPCVSEGRVYVLDGPGVACLDARDGARVWGFKPEGDSGGFGPVFICNEMCVAHKRVYVGTTRGLLCLDAQSGRRLWHQLSRESVQVEKAPCVDGNRVYVAGPQALYCLAGSTGAKLWEYKTPLLSLPRCHCASQGRVYCSAGGLLCLDAAQGRLLWKFDRGVGTPCVSGQRVYTGGTKDKFHCLDAQSGAPLWTFNPFPGVRKGPGGGFSSVDSDKDSMAFYQAYPCLWGDRIFVRCSGNNIAGEPDKLLSLDARRGTKLWEVELGGAGPLPICLGEGRVYVVGRTGEHTTALCCIAAEDGKVLWERPMNTPGAWICLSSGRLFVHGQVRERADEFLGGNFSCLLADKGDTGVWEMQGGGPARSGVAWSSQR